MNNMTPDEMAQELAMHSPGGRITSFDPDQHKQLSAEQMGIVQYIATGVASYQISEDRWQVSTLTKIFEAGATVAQIFEWAKRKNVDLNTIQVHQNEK